MIVSLEYETKEALWKGIININNNNNKKERYVRMFQTSPLSGLEGEEKKGITRHYLHFLPRLWNVHGHTLCACSFMTFPSTQSTSLVFHHRLTQPPFGKLKISFHLLFVLLFMLVELTFCAKPAYFHHHTTHTRRGQYSQPKLAVGVKVTLHMTRKWIRGNKISDSCFFPSFILSRGFVVQG